MHMFLEGADVEMARIATNMLAKDTVSLPDLRYKVRAAENSTWYKRPHQVKFTQEKDNWEGEGLGGARGSGRQPGSQLTQELSPNSGTLPSLGTTLLSNISTII